jgi:hypothetical protein
MICPLFKDYTRECVKDYKCVIQVPTFDVCESGNYVECPIYNIITDKVEKCEYTSVCDENIPFAGVDFKRLKYIGNKFCLHGNERNCAIYKLRKIDKEVPKNLSPDGSIRTLIM